MDLSNFWAFFYYVQVRENFESADILTEDTKQIPLAEIMLMTGFFLIYFIEEFVHCLCDAQLHSENDGEEEIVEHRRRKLSVATHR